MAKVSGRGMQFFCSLFIVIGLVAVGAGVWMLVKSLRSEHWPVTDGVVLTAEMSADTLARQSGAVFLFQRPGNN